MDKKYNLTGGKTTVDLKQTQIELLKIKHKLQKLNVKDKESFLLLFKDIFSKLEPIVNYISDLKKIKVTDSDSKLFHNSDVVTKLLNVYDFDEIQFKYNKLSKVIPPLRLKNINLNEIEIDYDLEEKTNAKIKENKKTLTINLDPISFSVTGDPIKKDVPKISFEGSFKTPIINDSSIKSDKHNLIFSDSLKIPQVKDVSSLVKPSLTLLSETPKLVAEPFKINLNDYKFDTDKDYSTEYTKLQQYAQEVKPVVRPDVDLKPLETEISTLQEKIEEINDFIAILLEPLDIDKIKQSIKDLTIRESTVLDKEIESTLTNGFLEVGPSEFSAPIIDSPFLNDKIKIKDIDVDLDKDPFILEGGNYQKYLEQMKQALKPTSEVETKKRLKTTRINFFETVNKFNLHYIQFHYFQMYLLQKFLENSSNKYFIYPILNLNVLQILYLDIREKYLIIINPKDNVFSESIETSEKNKRKKLFFKHYYIIHLLYFFHKFLVEKAIEFLEGNHIEAENYDFSKDTFTNKHMINLIIPTENIELKRMLVLFNFYMFK